MRYLILVVNYKKNIKESETIKSLIQINMLKKSKLIIWDNIPVNENYSHQKMLKNNFDQFEYIPSEKNEKLSSVYNYIINNKLNNYDFLIIFDNDSSITSDYFTLLDENINNNAKVNLFLPIVKSSGIIVSPAKMLYFKGFYYKKLNHGKVKAKYKTAINSGMVISSRYLREHFKGYDEQLSLYGVDDYFMRQYSNQNEYFCVINYEIQHSLSVHVKESTEIKLFRFLNLKNGIRVVNKDVNFILKGVIEIYLFFCSFKESVKYKNLKFFAN